MSKCPNCGLETDGKFCPECGSFVPQAAPAPVRTVSPEPNPTYTAPVTVNNITNDTIPEKYRPLGAWAYFGYSLLFAIPIVGFILLIVFSFSDSNINRRNFARSFWCGLLVSLILTILIVIIMLLAGVDFSTIANNGMAGYKW